MPTKDVSRRCSLVVILFLLSALGLAPHAVGQIFSAPQFYSAGALSSSAVKVGDLNGDGIPDLVVANVCVDSATCGLRASVGVLLGNGDGTFQAVQNYDTGGVYPQYSNSIALADVNGDGHLDIIAANCTKTYCGADTLGVIGVLLGNGDGTFQAAQTYSTGGVFPTGIVVADLNGDGKPDLIVDSSMWSSVGILLGNGDGTFQPVTTFWSGGSYAYSFGAGDLNGDGKLDLVVLNGCSPSNHSSCWVVTVLLGNGDGTFQPPHSYPVNGKPDEVYSRITVGDVNGDGVPDLILELTGKVSTSIPPQVTIWIGNGDGSFSPGNTYSSGTAIVLVVLADVNGDGKADLVMPGHCVQSQTSCIPGLFSVLTGNGDGTFQPALVYPVALGNSTVISSLSTLAVADVNGDGKPDVIGCIDTFISTPDGVIAGPSQVSVSLSGGFARPVATISGSPQPPITKNAAGNYVAHVTITNSGNISIDSVQVTIAGTSLGSGSFLAAPAAITNLAPGASAVVTLKFPPNSITSGSTSAPLKVSGTYSVSNPVLSGNWNLSFRSVSLQ